MTLKTIITVLAAVAVLSTAGTGALYYQSLRDAAVEKAATRIEHHAVTLSQRLQSSMEDHFRTAAVVAGFSQVHTALTNPSEKTLGRVNVLMDRVQRSLGLDVCYLIDRTGRTAAASNRGTPQSFVGKNYGFRPYVTESLAGTPSVYMAVGVTSGKKGIYHAHPVVLPGADRPAGVLVLKDGVALLREKLADPDLGHPGVSMLVGPRGVIFLSSRPNWEGKLLWRLSEKDAAALAAGRQFGPGSWEWSGLSRKQSGRVTDRRGEEYLMSRQKLSGVDGWQVIHLAGLEAQIREAVAPLKETVGTVSLVMLLLVGIAVLVLHRQAVADLRRKKTMHDALEEREERLRQVLDSIQAGVLIVSTENHEVVDVNPAAADMIGEPINRIVGRVCHRFVCPAEEGKCPVTDLEQEIDNAERTLLRTDGSQIPILKTASYVSLEGEKHLLETFIDISALKNAQQALEQEHARLVKSEKKLAAAQRIASIGNWEWSIDENTVAWSDEFARIFGISECEPSAEAIAALIHPEDRAGWQERLKSAVQETGKLETVCRGVHADSTVIWLHVEAEVTRGADGRPAALFGIVQDISDRRRWEEALRRQRDFLDTLMQTLPSPMYHKDLDGRYTGCNAAFEAFSGKKREEIIGKTIFDLWPGKFAERYHTMDQELLQDPGTQHFQGKLTQADGRVRDVIFDKATIRDKNGRTAGIIGILSDISEMVAARKKAEEASRAKSEFLANMSHEIRTPMNGVVGMTELALATDLTEEQRDYLETIKQSAENLMAIINDILDFSKIESGRMELEIIGFHLRSTMEEAAGTLAVKADQRELELICDIPPEIPCRLMGDPGKIRQILLNLGGNAIKFTESGEMVLQCREEKRSGNRLRLHFSVSDTGIGIPADKIDAIFESFRQADGSTTRKFGGTGLGLSISRKYAEMMGGRMWVESIEGQGSTFHFTAEFSVQHREEAEPFRLAAADLCGKRVLIVDDNATNRRILKEMAGVWQMHCETVPGGTAAIEALERAAAEDRPYQLMLLDLQMPDVDGFEVARSLRERSDIPRPGVILLTSMGRRGDAARCRDHGIDAYLIKPVKQNDLFEALQLVFSGSHIEEKREEDGPVTRHTLRDRRYDGGKQILLAEDEAINRKVAVNLLEKLGYRVAVAENGAEAVALIRRRRFDLVLMDVQMPEKDGYAATREIRSTEKERGGHVPIVAMTAHAVKGDREKCLAAGMDDYLAKPIRADRLREIIERWTGPATGGVQGGISPHGGGNEASRPEDAPPIDMKKALDQLMGNRGLLEELLDEFCVQSEVQLSAITAAAASGDGERLRNEAHRLKGTAANLWAGPIAAASLALENAGRKGELGGVEALVRELKVQIQRFQRYVKERSVDAAAAG